MPVNNAALVVGGGIAGMTAALALADQGFPVHLVEKTGELGGTARQLHRTLDGEDVQALPGRDDRARALRTTRIQVYLDARVAKVGGPRRRLHLDAGQPDSGHRSVKHGVVVVATGATEQKPQSVRLRPKRPGAHATGAVRPAGPRRARAAATTPRW